MLAPSPETVGRVKVEFPYLARQHRPEKIVVLRPDESEAVARTEVAAQVEQIFGADGCPAESAVSEIRGGVRVA